MHVYLYLFIVSGVESERDVDAEYAVNDIVEDEHGPAGVLSEGYPPRNNHHAIHNQRPHEEVPVNLARVLRFRNMRGFRKEAPRINETAAYPQLRPSNSLLLVYML